ncbi:MAG: acyl phosphate:glycerol-3-phosphate acyltransferase [Actinomycetota bacterium]|nr:acyl phosphate:glycerol-3-phosphate acyltransferase [Actinomycetota bacterium]
MFLYAARSLASALAPVASAVSGYLIGTLPSADIAARLATKGAADLRAAGSGNPGAVNAMAVLGQGWGSAILAADTLKGVAACVAGGWLAGPVGAHVAGTAAVVGHCFPVWNGFRGGKGVAVSLGQCLATFPAYLPIDLAVAWGVGKWSGRALPGTAAASATWVAAGTLWATRRWPNLWGPTPSPALPLASAASSAVILYRFATARRPEPVPRPALVREPMAAP